MKKIISALILALLLSSCVTRRACESTNTLTVIRDTTILVKIPGDSVEAVVPSVPLSESSRLGAAESSVPQTNVSTLNTRLAKSTIWLKDGRLHHRLEQKDTTVPATIKGALKTTHKTSIIRSQKERTIQQTRYANQLTGWQWTQVYLGRIFLGVLVVIFLWGNESSALSTKRILALAKTLNTKRILTQN